MFRWYVVNTYSGHENKVKANLEHRVKSMSQEHACAGSWCPPRCWWRRRTARRSRPRGGCGPGYVLVNMDLTDDAWVLVKTRPA